MILKFDRKLNRMPRYDYSQPGYYFVTICTKDGTEFFGEIKDEKMNMNEYGEIVFKYWNQIPEYYKNVCIDKFIIMPNHLHAIIIINDVGRVGTEYYSVPTANTNKLNTDLIDEKPSYGLLSNIIKSSKRESTICIRKYLKDYDFQWQRSFHDHIIRDEDDLARIRQYIKDNSCKWHLDRNNPENINKKAHI